VAAGFPTTVNPIIQNRLVPVFVDVTLPTLRDRRDAARSRAQREDTAVMIAHTLGNTFDLDAVTAFCKKYNLWLVEDCCDALGSTYVGPEGGHLRRYCDGELLSRAPHHDGRRRRGDHRQAGAAGAHRSFRDWGRDCWCEPGKDNTCGKRFDWQLGHLPCGYDHKYTYSHIGYNLKATDMQAALGVSQIDKLPHFIERRKENFALPEAALKPLEEFLVLPEATPNSDPSWFGFPIGVKSGMRPFTATS
jgi:CDP-6-deoxy-D-xylo-4-hexulose-3-dehydrase